MLKKIKSAIRKNIIEPISISAVLDTIRADKDLKEIWDFSYEQFPDFSEHFSQSVDNAEVEHRIRQLVVAETAFVKEEIARMLQEKGGCEYADIGDSDGSVRLLLKKYFSPQQLSTVGINLQTQAVEKMKQKGLHAICEDALNLKTKGIQYDIASVFETLEHLPSPINFLTDIRDVVRHKLVISVPFVRRSRVSLSYLTHRWDHSRRPTIENVHIFELSPADWFKIFLHTGWQIDREKKLMMFPPNKPSRFILQPYWFYTSFEGFWFVSLSKCDKFSSRYTVE